MKERIVFYVFINIFKGAFVKKNYIFLLCLLTFLGACRSMSVTNTNFRPKINTNPKAQEKEEKIQELDKSISVVKDKYSNFYYSNRDSFVKDMGNTYYITPYIVEEFGLVNRLSLRIFIKVISEKENTFDKVTFYSEKGNKILIDFNKITRNYNEETGFIEESAHGIINLKDIRNFEKFIDNQDLFVIFEKKEKHLIKLPYPVRNAVLDVIRKYKVLEENY